MLYKKSLSLPGLSRCVCFLFRLCVSLEIEGKELMFDDVNCKHANKFVMSI